MIERARTCCLVPKTSCCVIQSHVCVRIVNTSNQPQNILTRVHSQSIRVYVYEPQSATSMSRLFISISHVFAPTFGCAHRQYRSLKDQRSRSLSTQCQKVVHCVHSHRPKGLLFAHSLRSTSTQYNSVPNTIQFSYLQCSVSIVVFNVLTCVKLRSA